MGQTVITPDGRFEWDADKSALNKKKHGLSFEEVLPIFDDPCMLEIYDESHSSDEERINGLGLLNGIVVLFACYTERKERTRVISARKATLKEEEAYYEHIARAFT
ncbi:MAG: BrnT family toxin [Fibromonadales bacterium]|nr:BrnT family toxin [Fibromonadales bacterium]